MSETSHWAHKDRRHPRTVAVFSVLALFALVFGGTFGLIDHEHVAPVSDLCAEAHLGATDGDRSSLHAASFAREHECPGCSSTRSRSVLTGTAGTALPTGSSGELTNWADGSRSPRAGSDPARARTTA